MAKQIKLEGIILPMPTSFDEDGEVAYDALRENLSRWNKFDLVGYVALGSTGEAVHLSESEKLRIIEVARENIPQDRTMIVGTGMPSTRETISFTRRATELGADAAMVITPYYYRSQMKHEAYVHHYTMVAEGSTIPILIYTVPQLTGVTIDPSTVAVLAQHENIIGIKESSGNFGELTELLRLTPPDFNVLIGSAPILYPGLAIGAIGAVLAVACVVSQTCIDIFKAFHEGDHSQAKVLQQRLSPVATAVTTSFGISGLKAAMDMFGYYGGPPRSPLRTPSDAVRAEIAKIFRESGLIEELKPRY